MAKYEAQVGLDWTTAKGQVRVEAGDPCDPPAKSVKWLLEQGLISEVGAADAPPPAEPVEEPTAEAPATAPAEEKAPDAPVKEA